MGGSRGAAACEADMLPTKLPHPVVKRQKSVRECNMRFILLSAVLKNDIYI